MDCRQDPGAGVGFAVPDGYTDLTHYAFQAPDGLRRLEVRPTAGLGGLDDLLRTARAYRDQLVDVLGATVVQDVTPGARPDGAEVATLSFTCPADDRRRWIVERAGFVRFADGGGAQVSFVSGPDDPQAESLFRRAINSVRPAGRGGDAGPMAFGPVAAPAPTADASSPAEVQRAGAVVLDVPEGLRPPTLFHFASPDGGVPLSLEVEPGADAGPVAYAAPSARGAGGLFGRVGVAQGDLGSPQRYEVMEEAATTRPVSFAPGAGAPATEVGLKGGGQATEAREAVIAGVRVRSAPAPIPRSGPGRRSSPSPPA